MLRRALSKAMNSGLSSTHSAGFFSTSRARAIYCVVRTDHNDNTFIMPSRFNSEADAQAEADRLTNLGHHQHYSAQDIKTATTDAQFRTSDRGVILTTNGIA